MKLSHGKSDFHEIARLLMEALLRAGNLLPDVKDHYSFLQFLVGPLIQEFRSDSVAQVR